MIITYWTDMLKYLKHFLCKKQHNRGLFNQFWKLDCLYVLFFFELSLFCVFILLYDKCKCCHIKVRWKCRVYGYLTKIGWIGHITFMFFFLSNFGGSIYSLIFFTLDFAVKTGSAPKSRVCKPDTWLSVLIKNIRPKEWNSHNYCVYSA